MTPTEHGPEPIACSLNSADLAERRRAWQDLLGNALRRREEIPGGLRLAVAPSAEATLCRLVELERECCPWIDFSQSGPVVTMTASDDGVSVLRQMFSPEPDPA